MDYDQSRFTKDQAVDLVATYVGIDELLLMEAVEIFMKLGVIPEYVFVDAKDMKAPGKGKGSGDPF